MNLEQILSETIEPIVRPVKVEGMDFVLEGMPDSFIVDITIMSVKKREGMAIHWAEALKDRGVKPSQFPVFQSKSTTEAEYDKVQQVLIVHHYLKPAEGQPDPTDIQIADLSARRGRIFTALFSEAVQILSNIKANQKPDKKKKTDLLTDVAVGNSKGPGESTPGS